MSKFLVKMKQISEASFVTSVEEASRVDQCTQTPPSGRPRPRTLQRYHTSDHIFERPHRPCRRPKSLGLSDSCPYFTRPPSYDSGISGFLPKYKVNSTESPTISVTPPHSLEYLCPKGGGSPNGSATPNGMVTRTSATTVLLSPGYLQSPCQCNQSIKSVSEVALTMPTSPAWNEEAAANNSPDGLSWRRLHMSRAKLKATATTSELLSGFAMVAMVELQINEPTNVPEWLFVMFAVCTTVLVAVHIFALMISTYLLPNIDAVSKMETPGGPTRALRDSPHERMRGFIELAWAFSTVLGLFLFLVEIAILCWVKFWDYSFAAATAATVIVIPVLIVFVAFAIHFYHSLVVQKCETSVQDIEQLESMKRDLDTATVKVNMF
ncbi:calcium release-activated calcium channel protein 1-like isoform X3 [Pectinophora gossypiella]|uniref:calcium release-activated calcium channel protein 1-like isoform X3 n=1 Tax=Pectinophora gossypiella TaxID=13191 RepID=UPI00214DFE21|nr:calcium release-activated calcium channel protein 1-like isoform X3 [Pectinophora gossypiella]